MAMAVQGSNYVKTRIVKTSYVTKDPRWMPTAVIIVTVLQVVQ